MANWQIEGNRQTIGRDFYGMLIHLSHCSKNIEADVVVTPEGYELGLITVLSIITKRQEYVFTEHLAFDKAETMFDFIEEKYNIFSTEEKNKMEEINKNKNILSNYIKYYNIKRIFKTLKYIFKFKKVGE